MPAPPPLSDPAIVKATGCVFGFDGPGMSDRGMYSAHMQNVARIPLPKRGGIIPPPVSLLVFPLLIRVEQCLEGVISISDREKPFGNIIEGQPRGLEALGQCVENLRD